MLRVQSAHSGTLIPPTNTELRRNWSEHNQGFVFGSGLRKLPKHQLALQYLREKNFAPENDFLHQHDCYYGDNWHHAELRGGHRFLRPSHCSKFVLRKGMGKFLEADWQYAYHGTNTKNVGSILQHGLRASGSRLPDGTVVKQTHGALLGRGV